MDFLRRALISVVATATLLCLHAGMASAQLSPGDLATAHEALEGISNCTKCHELGEGPSANKCLTCHTVVRQRLEQQDGFHYGVVGEEGRACFDCHSDHAGRDFDLIHWSDGEANFDHVRTGFVLEGKHAALQCRECHNPALIRENLTALMPDKDMTRTFFGLDTTCLSCHADQHRGHLGTDCLRCHTNDAFRPATGFSHDSTRFALTGKHRQVDCSGCHPMSIDKVASVAVSYRQYSGLRFDNCTACHQDEHQGKFGLDCTRCHQTSGWHTVTTAGFDHRQTGFPLIGHHAALECEKCHTSGRMSSKIPHDRCVDCHADIHRGQFSEIAIGTSCANCHNEYGFSPPLYTVRDHAKSQFVLVGAHLAQPCVACHRNETAADGSLYRVFNLSHEACTSCHTDPHGGQFTESSPQKECTTCHNEFDWHQLQFDHDRDTYYKLVGAHRQVKCSGCHKSEQVGTVTLTRYRPTAHRCEDCHRVRSVSKEL